MNITITSGVVYFMIAVLFSVLGAIALIYLIMILMRISSVLKKVNKNMGGLLTDLNQAVNNTNEILKVVSDNQQQLDKTIKSVAKITDDASQMTNSINKTVTDVTDVFGATKNITSKINRMSTLVTSSIDAVNKRNKKAKKTHKIDEEIKTPNGEIELKGVKVEVGNE